ncbi:hypothetical protein [Micromonospora chersina]|uniref:hypothetical protein n=1 Tax=Micromonospora chersina TaxID=47854 RepID=UPI0033DF04D7
MTGRMPMRGEAGPWLEMTALWLGSAGAAGVVGNAAYDVIKAGIGRLRRPEVPPDAPDPELVLVAREAANRQGGDSGVLNLSPDRELAEPGFDASCALTPDGCEFLFWNPHYGPTAAVEFSLDEESGKVKVVVRVPEKLVSQRTKDSAIAFGVLRTVDGWEPPLPPE